MPNHNRLSKGDIAGPRVQTVETATPRQSEKPIRERFMKESRIDPYWPPELFVPEREHGPKLAKDRGILNSL